MTPRKLLALALVRPPAPPELCPDPTTLQVCLAGGIHVRAQLILTAP